MSDMKLEAVNTAMRVNAYVRVALRRWLRSQLEGEIPNHLWLDYDLQELMDEVSLNGGDVDTIVDCAREEIVDRISQDRGYEDER